MADDTSLVAVYGPEGTPTEACWEIIENKQNIAQLVNVTTGRKMRVHISRIVDPINPERSEIVAKAKPKAEETEGKATNSKFVPFDLVKFIKDNGSEHWVRGADGGTKFDHPEYKLVTHAVMNEKAGHYYIINTYEKDDVVSLGRSGKGITQYPLKGHQVTYTVSQTAKKVDSRGTKRVRKGTKPADDVRKHWQKSGYEKQ